MGAPALIGDELNAAGFRLAGITVYTPAPGQELSLFREVLALHDLVLITVGEARHLPTEELNSALRGLSPPVLVLPDILEREPLRKLGQRIRRQLGLKL